MVILNLHLDRLLFLQPEDAMSFGELGKSGLLSASSGDVWLDLFANLYQLLPTDLQKWLGGGSASSISTILMNLQIGRIDKYLK